jgi:hypothetical protein
MRRVLVLLFVLVLQAACRQPPSVVGTWTGTLSGFDAKATFTADKALSVSLKVGAIGADITGTYEMDPKNLTLQLKTYKLKGVPDQQKTLATQIMDALMKQPLKGAYHFNSSDELAVTYNGKTDVLKRAKEEQQ